MLSILLHSSKTMRATPKESKTPQIPRLMTKATQLVDYCNHLSVEEVARVMHLSQKKAAETATQFQQWSLDEHRQLPAIDAFIGDIYSGLQAQTLNVADREYAHKHLIILSGLYGALKALDHVRPYRLEMGYKLPNTPFKNLYEFWGSDIAACIPGDVIINLSAVEYTKAVFPHLSASRHIITPKFMTKDPTTQLPKFVVVHAKVARGAYANWLIKNRIQDTAKLKEFDQLGYVFEPALSTPEQPVFVCDEFGGLGLSIRLS